MSVSKNRSRLLFAAPLFFICSVIVLSGLRFALFEVYRSPELTFSDFLPAFITGLKVDAKWLSILFLPAWILTALSLWRGAFRKTAIVLAAAALAGMVTLDLVNFGFFGFYRTPISPIVFGLFQDDTKAIIITIFNDWPVFRYLGVLCLLTALPIVAVLGLLRIFPKRDVLNGLTAAIVYALLTLMLAGAVRGSFGTFPLRLQDFSVSPNPFINATVPNGAAALYEAFKGRKALQLDGPPEIALTEMGFNSNAEALAVLKNGQEPAGMTPAASQPHVVLAVMESMGRDFFEAHKPGVNDMLGRLADELPHGTVFLTLVLHSSLQGG